MTAAVLPWVLAMLGLAVFLSLWRLVRGPGLPDRILALDTLYVVTTALLVALGIWLDSGVYFEAAMIIALLGFVGTVAFARYLERGDVVE
jgi:multicomponent K+:H+ antiporter subunit F